MSAAELMKVEVGLANSQKQARLLCEGDHIIHDERVMRVKDVSFMGKRHVVIEAQIITRFTMDNQPVEINITEARDFVFTVITPYVKMG